MTRDELHALPPAVDMPTAAEILGIGKGLAYDLVRRGEFPTPILRIGRFIKVPTAPLIALVGAGAAIPDSAEPGQTADVDVA